MNNNVDAEIKRLIKLKKYLDIKIKYLKYYKQYNTKIKLK